MLLFRLQQPRVNRVLVSAVGVRQLGDIELVSIREVVLTLRHLLLNQFNFVLSLVERINIRIDPSLQSIE